MDFSKILKSLPKISLNPSVKKNLPRISFYLIIPVGMLVGYFFSQAKDSLAGGFNGLLNPVNRMLYVAKVDGVGIPKSEWETILKSRYGKNAVRELVDIYTVRNALNKAGIIVSDAEIDAEIASIKEQLAGQDLEEILGQQGRTLADFRKDVYLQVGMKKLLSDKIVVTDQEVEDYIKSAGEDMPGANDEEKRANAKKALTDQKLSEEINKWFTDLQGQTKVENYLETQ